MANLITLQGSDPIKGSRETINQNFIAVMSDFAGTSFPTENLAVGMTFYNTDEKKTYRLTALPNTWEEEKSASTWNEIEGKPNFAAVATSGSYNDLSNKPTIPTKISQLENDSGFMTEFPEMYVDAINANTSNIAALKEKTANITRNNAATVVSGVTIQNGIVYGDLTGNADTATSATKAAQDNKGNVISDTYATITQLNAKAPLVSNAGAHNSIFRGKNLGTSVTSAQWAVIKAGTFEDMYIGDYWSIGGVDYVIAAFDYYLKTGDNAAVSHHHVTLVPRTALYNEQMNETDVVTGGYVGSKMYISNLNQAKTTIQNAFGSAHILTVRQLFTTATNAQYGFATAYEWSDASVWLMNEVNVYGCYIHTDRYHIVNSWTASKFSIDISQYPLFAFDKTAIHTRYSYWLRDVATSEHFANVSSYSYSSLNTASYSSGVRPAFNIYQS